MAPDHLTKALSAVYWRGGDTDLEQQLYHPRNKRERVVAWGGFASVTDIAKYRPGIDLVAFDPKISRSILGADTGRRRGLPQPAANPALRGRRRHLLRAGFRRLYRITQAIYDGLEERHRTRPVQVLDLFHTPEFHIAEGRLRIAKIQGTLDTCLRDPRVAAHRAKVQEYLRSFPELTRRWTENLVRSEGRRDPPGPTECHSSTTSPESVGRT